MHTVHIFYLIIKLLFNRGLLCYHPWCYYILNLGFITKLVLFINSVLCVEHTVNVILSHIFSSCMSKDHSFYEMYDRRIIHFMDGFLVDDCTDEFYVRMTIRSSILLTFFGLQRNV